jgi:hypothetical protein
MYNNRNEKVTIGKTQPMIGTKIPGKKEAAIVKIPIKLQHNSK